MENHELIALAREAQKNAYTPYSKFQVGAALLTKSGKVYTGCNIENISFTPTICAERTAVFKAISEGERDFEKIAVTSSGDGFSYPCGVCRQVLAEFMPRGKVLLADPMGNIEEYSVSDLLPHSFDLLKG